ncbi:hypothetical protein MBAV_001415 [Candidatus Magnetobacterium bavaricum]|uniref:Uncharacterized protein n=1 Tax=Candidatus Magnetobacterium bavaricum TaxID=29290 RepID=A0A0F3GX18_9BACT|nr:hypothetical protein MBAV_001415 [Candidatus Magnetobacterium bavaricum]
MVAASGTIAGLHCVDVGLAGVYALMITVLTDGDHTALVVFNGHMFVVTVI